MKSTVQTDLGTEVDDRIEIQKDNIRGINDMQKDKNGFQRDLTGDEPDRFWGVLEKFYVKNLKQY